MIPREHKGASVLADRKDYVALDLETTGYDPRLDEIIEIGAIKVRNGQPIDRYGQLINPGRHIPNIVTEIHGIDDGMVKNAPTLADVLSEFLDWMGDGLILGHNVNFDINFLYDNAEDICGKYVGNDFIDTLRLARYLYPEERHNRLQDLIVRFDIAEDQEHRALADVEQTIACYRWMIRHMNENGIPFPAGDGRSRRGLSSLFRGGDQLLQIAPQDEVTPDPAFENLTFVFTGALKKMTRANAQQAVTNLGGINGKTVTKDTNYLITGSTDYNAALKGSKSSKWLKAEKLQLAGQDLNIISEDVFYDMLGDSIAQAPTQSQLKFKITQPACKKILEIPSGNLDAKEVSVLAVDDRTKPSIVLKTQDGEILAEFSSRMKAYETIAALNGRTIELTATKHDEFGSAPYFNAKAKIIR